MLGVGFRNRGASCYLNSLIIALLHVPKFVNWILHFHEAETCDVTYCVACALHYLTLAYWNDFGDSRKTETALADFAMVIARGQFHDSAPPLVLNLNQFSASPKGSQAWSKREQERQQDASEFYTWLLSKLEAQAVLSYVSHFSKYTHGLRI